MFHVAWFEEACVLDLWESPQDFGRFGNERLMPKLHELGIGSDHPDVQFHEAYAYFTAVVARTYGSATMPPESIATTQKAVSATADPHLARTAPYALPRNLTLPLLNTFTWIGLKPSCATIGRNSTLTSLGTRRSMTSAPP